MQKKYLSIANAIGMSKSRVGKDKVSWRIVSVSGEKQISIGQGDGYFLKPYVQPEEVLILREPELAYGHIKPMVQYLGYSQQELADVLEVDPSTLFRWSKGDKTIGKMRSKTMYDIDDVIAKGVKVFGSEGQLKEWLNTVNYALGNQKPIELLKSPYGIEQVDNAMEAMLWGNVI